MAAPELYIPIDRRTRNYRRDSMIQSYDQGFIFVVAESLIKSVIPAARGDALLEFQIQSEIA